jgi:hypothetical protein
MLLLLLHWRFRNSASGNLEDTMTLNWFQSSQCAKINQLRSDLALNVRRELVLPGKSGGGES